MAHAIEVSLNADVTKFNTAMASAKKTSSDSMGSIAAIFSTVTAYFSKIWDAAKSFFSDLGSKAGGAWDSFKSSASGALEKVLSMFPGVGSATKDVGDEAEKADKKTDSWLSKLGYALLGVAGIAVAVAAAIAALAAKGMLVDSAFAKIAISTDVGAGSLSKLSDVAKKSGMTVEQLGASVSTFQGLMKEAAAGTGGKVFSDLGVDVKNGKDELLATVPTLVDFAKHVAGMSSEAEKYGAAQKSGFSVQFLEDLARAGKLAASTTDDQAEKVDRLGKIFREIQSSGVSVWDQISTALSNKLTPALTTASIAVLENKNKIINAFKDIYAGGDFFDKIGNKIAGWANDMAGYFAKVVTGAANAGIKVMEYIGTATGLGNSMTKVPSVGDIPKQTQLASGKPSVVPTKADEDAAKKYDDWTKSVKGLVEAQELEKQSGAALTQGQRMQLALTDGLRDGTIKETTAQVAARQALIDTVLANEKQIASSRQAQSDADALAKKQEQSYASITASIQTKIAQNELEVLTGNAVTDGQKLAIKIQKDLEAGKKSLTAVQIADTQAQLSALAVSEKVMLQGKAQKEINNYVEEGSIARTASRNALEAEYESYGKSADALALLMVAVNSETESQKEQDKLRKEGLPVSDETIRQLEKERDERTKAGQATLGQSQAIKLANDLLAQNKQYDADSISDPLERAKAQLKLVTDVQQATLKGAGETTEARKNGDEQYATWYERRMKEVVANVNLEQANLVLDAMNQLDASAQSAAQGMANAFGAVGAAIGDLTSALSGYGVKQAAIAKQLADSTANAGGDTTKIQRANELAAQQSAQAQIHSYGDMAGAAKGFFKENSSGYKVMAAAEKAYRVLELAMAVDNMVVKSGLLTGYTGLFVASKATEVTATVATVPVTVAAEGVKQASLATTAMAGAVAVPFPGNIAAFAIVAAMLAAIGLAGMGGGGGSAPSVSEQRQASQGTGTVLGDNSAKSESIKNSLELSAANSSTLIVYTNGMLLALRAIQSSIGGLSTQLVQGGLSGAVTDSSSSGFWSKLGTSIFGGKVTTDDVGISTSVTSVANALMNGLNASKYVQTTTSGGWFSSDKHNTATSSLGDTANAQFQKVISGIVTSVKTAAGLLGINGDDFSNRLNSFVIDIGKISIKDMTGDQIQTALEAAFSKLGDQMAEFSVAGLSSLANVGEGYLETLTRVATDYAKMDASLQSIGMTFGSVGVSSLAAREDLISMMGGIDAMASVTADFASNYLTKAQQNAPVLAYVTDQMAKLGLASVTTRDQFAKVVTDLNLSDPASATLYANLMNLEAAFAATHAATVDLTKSEQDIADERSDMQSTFDQLTLTSTQLRAKERLSIDASNLALFDQITYLQTIADTSDTLKTSISNLKAFRDGILSFKDSLTLGSLSTLTPMQKAAEAKNQYDAILAKAEGGDTTAQAGVQAAATAFLTASQVVNASSSAYVADAARVQADMATLAAIAGTQMDESQQQLDYLNQQVTQLAALNATASGIATALTTSDWSAVGTSDMSPLVDEIKGLRDDNASLKADNAALLTAINNQTAAVVSATLAASASNAAAVTAGAQETAASQVWQQQLLAEVAAK